MTEAYEWRVITPRIWQIQEDRGVCCTLVQGAKLAILMDTGYGERDIRAFVESHVRTPYMVINSHAHPDHAGGNRRFSHAYAMEAEIPQIRRIMGDAECRMHPLAQGRLIDLGGLTAEVVPLAGHTAGHLGLLLREERILLSSDALSEYVWLFGPGSLTLPHLRETILRTLELPFDHYLCGHATELTPKHRLLAHLRHIDQLDITRTQPGKQFNYDILKSVFADELGRSVLIFDAHRPENWEKKPRTLFRLGVVEESLKDRNVLEAAASYFADQRIERVEGDEIPLWHVDEFRLPEQELQKLLEPLAQAMKPTWYAHAFDGETMYVILAGRWFRLNAVRDEGWVEMIAYGTQEAGVERRYLENISCSI